MCVCVCCVRGYFALLSNGGEKLLGSCNCFCFFSSIIMLWKIPYRVIGFFIVTRDRWEIDMDIASIVAPFGLFFASRCFFFKRVYVCIYIYIYRYEPIMVGKNKTKQRLFFGGGLNASKDPFLFSSRVSHNTFEHSFPFLRTRQSLCILVPSIFS